MRLPCRWPNGSEGLAGQLRDITIPGIVIANHAIVATRDTGG
jgi:hypothetical protein